MQNFFSKLTMSKENPNKDILDTPVRVLCARACNSNESHNVVIACYTFFLVDHCISSANILIKKLDW
jgi:hypothetical protein